MFNNRVFGFPIYSLRLTQGRVRVLTDLIEQRQGVVSNQLDCCDYIIVGDDIHMDCNILIAYKQRVLKAEWISNSIKQGSLLDTQLYQMYVTSTEIEEEVPIIMNTEQSNTLFIQNWDMLDYQTEWDIIKKEELQSDYEHPPVKNDEECMLTGFKLFEGITIIEDPLNHIIVPVTKHIVNRKKPIWEPKRSEFVCEKGSAATNCNAHIIAELDKLNQCYKNERDKGRHIAYSRAIGYIRSLTFPIENEAQVDDMPTIGKKIKAKIVEIIATGKLGKAEYLYNQEKNLVIEQLTKVWGVGTTTAIAFYDQGIKSIEQLIQQQHLLNKNQLIGLKYLKDFQIRIPRDEVTQIFEIVRNEIGRLSDADNVYESIPVGSYRRGKESCGDIDILITRKNGNPDSSFLLKLVTNLEGKLLTEHLTHPKVNPNGSESYMGVGRIGEGGVHRRIDLKIYPKEQFGYAVLYFTGSDQFNRSMRLYAQSKGYTLSDHGVYPTMHGAHNKKVWKGNAIPCFTEMDVFNLLELEYRQPSERSV